MNVALAAGVACVIGLAWCARATPEGLTLLGWRVPETCLHRALTARPCPGCGTTRSVVLALQLRGRESRRAHPSGLYVAAWLAAQGLARVLLALTGPSRPLLWLADLSASAGTFVLAVSLPMVLQA